MIHGTIDTSSFDDDDDVGFDGVDMTAAFVFALVGPSDERGLFADAMGDCAFA